MILSDEVKFFIFYKSDINQMHTISWTPHIAWSFHYESLVIRNFMNINHFL